MKPEAVINQIPQEVHQYLWKQKAPEMPDMYKYRVLCDLQEYNLENKIKDVSEWIDLPLPVLDCPLDEWVQKETAKEYELYINLAEKAKTITPECPIPRPSTYRGWSKFDTEKNKWVKISQPESPLLFLDFEAINISKNKWRAFLCCAVGQNGEWYSWVAEDFHNLPEVISFGNTFRLGVGHNVVEYDRRYIKESYEYMSPVRYLDTLSLYYLTMGMSSGQQIAYKKFQKEGKILPWMRHTCPGNLKDLSKFLGYKSLDKDVRKKIEKLQASEIEENLNELWFYCAEDVGASIHVFKNLYPRWREYSPHIISIAGQLERSCLRIKVDPNFKTRLAAVDKCVTSLRSTRNTWLTGILNDLTYETAHPYIQQASTAWIEREFFNRVAKTKGFTNWCSDTNTNPDNFPLDEEIVGYYLFEQSAEQETEDNEEELLVSFKDFKDEYDAELEALGIVEKEESPIKKLDPRQVKVISRLSAVKKYLENNQVQSKRKTFQHWKANLLKNPDEKLNEPYISVMGKITPYLIELKWMGKPLYFNGFTWGIWENGVFKKLPHPKGGNDNVASPLSKDFVNQAIAGEFDSEKVDILALFSNISAIALWESFRSRFEKIYIYQDTWLPEVVPSGAITERMTGKLAVVMGNTKFDPSKPPHEQGNRPGMEMKTFFCVDDGHTKVSGDYPGQESGIFATIIDAEIGFPGSTAYTCQIHAGRSEDKTDIHSLSSLIFGIPRPLAKNCNFANQFLCGKIRLAIMIYLGCKGEKPFTECEQIAIDFQNKTRGVQIKDFNDPDYGYYRGGLASEGFNACKKMAKSPGQRTRYLGRKISDALDARWCQSEMTTKFNYSIQSVGQELINTCLVVIRIFASKYNIPIQPCFLIHDEAHIDTPTEYAHDVAWLFQIGHFFSKALMNKCFGVRRMPLNSVFLETIEFDKYLRKSPIDPCVTPSNPNPIPLGKIIPAKECIPRHIHKDVVNLHSADFLMEV